MTREVTTPPAEDGVALAAPDVDKKALRRVVSGAIVGGVIEWFDYFIYAQAAALIFPILFFAGTEPLIGILLSFSTFAVGQFARPLGAIFFGNLGDRIGRKPTLVATFILMGIATFLIGLLPTYETIGVLAPVLLVLLRIAQGFGAGAEFAGASIILLEYAPRHRRGLFGSFANIGAAAGFMLGTLAFLLLQLLPQDVLLAWGWRIPFILSALLVAVGLWIRYWVDESPLFQKVVENRKVQKTPVLEVVRQEWRSLLLVFALASGMQMSIYIFLTWIMSYLGGLTGDAGAPLYTLQEITFFVFLSGIAGVIGNPLWGLLSDKIGRRAVFGGAALLTALLVVPFFLLLGTGNPVVAAVAIVAVGGCTTQMMSAVQGSLFGEIFSTKLRFSGFAIGREISAAIFGGLSPLLATVFVALGGGSFWGVAAYVAAICVLTFVAVLFARETSNTDLKL